MQHFGQNWVPVAGGSSALHILWQKHTCNSSFFVRQRNFQNFQLIWRTWCFGWHTLLAYLFLWLVYLLVLVGVLVAWHVQSGPFRVLCGKKYASWKKYTNSACGACDKSQLCVQDSTRGGILGLPNHISGTKSCDGKSCRKLNYQVVLSTLNYQMIASQYFVLSMCCIVACWFLWHTFGKEKKSSQIIIFNL